jgi:hypothetical protein
MATQKAFWISLLFASLTISSLLSPVAQAAQPALNCEATIDLLQGGNLSYRLTGAMQRDSSGQSVSPPVISDLALRVQRRDRRGQVQTTVQRGSMVYFETIAPDADYSQLPFSGHFRGKPNDGRGIYSLNGSVHGLYVSLRPLNDAPKQMQVVHYLGNRQFVRSGPGICRVTA